MCLDKFAYIHGIWLSLSKEWHCPPLQLLKFPKSYLPILPLSLEPHKVVCMQWRYLQINFGIGRDLLLLDTGSFSYLYSRLSLKPRMKITFELQNVIKRCSYDLIKKLWTMDNSSGVPKEFWEGRVWQKKFTNSYGPRYLTMNTNFTVKPDFMLWYRCSAFVTKLNTTELNIDEYKYE